MFKHSLNNRSGRVYAHLICSYETDNLDNPEKMPPDASRTAQTTQVRGLRSGREEDD
jgi:hypothetical protein